MGRTISWMRDNIRGLSKQDALYYKTFNDMYYNHKRPTEETCAILGITMDQAKAIIKESNAIENRQRVDCQNYSISQTKFSNDDSKEINHLKTGRIRKRPVEYDDDDR